MTNMMPDMMRVSDLAKIMDLSNARVYALIQKRELPSVRIGGAVRIPSSAYRRWIDQQTEAALASLTTKDA